MIVQKKNFFVLIVLVFTLVFNSFSQEKSGLWDNSNRAQKQTEKKLFRKSIPTSYKKLNLNFEGFKSALKDVKSKGEVNNKSSVVLKFPNEKGELEKYEVFEAPIMEKGLQERFPNIRSYVGENVKKSSKTIRFSVTNLGLHGMIMGGENGTVFIDPETTSKSNYLVYKRNQLPVLEPFECKFDEFNEKTSSIDKNVQAKAENADDGNLRTFRLAIATTGEYSQFHLTQQGVSDTATDEEKKAAVLSAIVTTMTRVNGIFERDVALTMVLVDNNTDIIFLDADTDNFTNDESSDLITESQTEIDTYIGSSNYDIGHTFSTGGGGLAQLNSPCTTLKARGITGSSSPIGDSYDVDYVAHEMGHQFGAHHTFNNSCSDNINSGTAVEPGSGSTIMSYAGICPPNIQNLVDDYYHQVSIQEIWANISGGNSTCAEITSTGNNVPVIEDLSNYTVPVSTPLILDAVANDVDGDNLTYTWEQLDIEMVTAPPVSTLTEGPVFRSLSPEVSSKRYLPNQATVVAGNLSNEWEVLPSVGRTMNFGVIVRDNQVGGGQTASKNLELTFDGNSGPFEVTSQKTSEVWSAGTSMLVEWNVANTNISPVSCTLVNILLSTDGGYTYPHTLATNVKNDGAYSVIAPNITTRDGRIKIESVGNIFYAINSADIEIVASDFIMNFSDNTEMVCEPTNAVYNFTYNTFNGFTEEVTFSAENYPTGSTVVFNPATATADATNVEVTVLGLSNSNIGTFDIDIVGTSSSTTQKSVAVLDVFSASGNPPVLTSPENNTVGLLNPIVLVWEASVNATSYNVQVATDDAFANVIVDETVETANLEIDNIETGAQFYWRVKSINSCGESEFSSSFNFETEVINCENISSTDVPKDIPDNSTLGVTSKLQINNNIAITDVNVEVNVTHPWVGDLTLVLTSPSGTEVILVESRDDEGDNYVDTVFDDDATQLLSSGTAPYTDSFKAVGNLSDFNGEEAFGEWELKIVDGGPEDVGTLSGWNLNICGVFSNVNYSFEIQTVGETCENEDNGQIIINPDIDVNYSATIGGNTFDFSGEYTIPDLTPGSYDLCITVDSVDFEQCYTVEIPEAVAISGKTENVSGKLNIDIESGTAPFSVYLNSNLVIETYSKNISLDVKNGDVVEVKSSIACEGALGKTISTFNEMTVYPNPTNGIFEIALPISENEAEIQLYNMQSQLVLTRSYKAITGKISLNIDNFPAGIYIGKVILNNESTKFKILKN